MRMTNRENQERLENMKIESAKAEGTIEVRTIKVIDNMSSICDRDGEHFIVTDENRNQYDSRGTKLRKGSTFHVLVITNPTETFVSNEIVKSVNVKEEGAEEVSNNWVQGTTETEDVPEISSKTETEDVPEASSTTEKADSVVDSMITGINQVVANTMKADRNVNRMAMEVYMYNEVDRRSKAYRGWMTSKLTLPEAYTIAGGG